MRTNIEHLDKIRGQKVLVIGDLMLDVYLHGKAHRVSPEAPVPVVLVERKEYLLGGAANVMNNIEKLGCRVWGFGFVGQDNAGSHLIELLSHRLESTDTIVKCDLPTIQKTRILADGQHVVRHDQDCDFRKLTDKRKFMCELLPCILETKEFACIVISDYNKGTINDEVMSIIRDKFDGPIVCDIKPENKSLFNDVFCIVPNLFEAKTVMGVQNGDMSPEKIARSIKEEMRLKCIVVTLSDHGILLIDQEDKCHILEAHTKILDQDPSGRLDVTGAGDTALSTFAACVGVGMPLNEAVYVANVSAGIVVKKVGTSVCTYRELVQEILK